MITKNSTFVGCLVLLIATVFFTGCMSDYDRSSGRVIDDRGITGKVRSNLNNSPVYKFPHVAVATYNGVVQLSGFVYKDEQKNEASELAKRVPGVTEVINSISLAPPGSVAVGGTVARDTTATGRDTNALPGTARNP